jgi:hypothetical protein
VRSVADELLREPNLDLAVLQLLLVLDLHVVAIIVISGEVAVTVVTIRAMMVLRIMMDPLVLLLPLR